MGVGYHGVGIGELEVNPRVSIVVVALALVGCKPDNEIARQSHQDVFYQEPTDEVDILWVVDNSPSMADEQAEVADKFEDFIVNLEETGLDFHVGVVTTDTDSTDQNGKLQGLEEGVPTIVSPSVDDYVGSFQDLVQVGVDGSDKERGIDAALKALSEPLISGYNEGFLREGATLSVIFVSDENDCTDRGALAGNDDASACYDNVDSLVSMKTLVDEFRELKDDGSRILASAIVGPDIVENCDGAKPGFRYRALAEGFGGIEGSICNNDFSDIMNELGLQVSGVLTTFQLTYPAVEDTIEVFVDDEVVPPDAANGWAYDDQYWIVSFHGDAVPERGAQIDIHYEVAAGSGATQGDGGT